MSEIAPHTPPDASTTTSASAPPDPQAEAAAQPHDPNAPDSSLGAPHADAGAASADAAPASPQLGGATPDARMAEARAADEGPGYVVSKPILSTGDYGHDVAYLAHLLAANGHDNAVAAGLRQPVLDDELMRMVREFQDASGIDPAGPQHGFDASGPAAAPLIRRDAEGIVDAATWAALLEGSGADVEAELKVELRYPKGAFA
jgi:peptidoglycan hydrolase-like protein with peptidoglycan-binding domain